MVLASRACGCLFGHPHPWKEPLRTPKSFCVEFLKICLKLIIEFFHLLIIHTTLIDGIMPYFDEFIHVYGWNRSILLSPLKNWTPKNFTTANFRHPVSKSWLRHCRHCWVYYVNTDLCTSPTQFKTGLAVSSEGHFFSVEKGVFFSSWKKQKKTIFSSLFSRIFYWWKGIAWDQMSSILK